MNTTGLTLMLMFAITHEPQIPPTTYVDGCLQEDVTDEGFPVMYCAGDGAVYSIDLWETASPRTSLARSTGGLLRWNGDHHQRDLTMRSVAGGRE